MIKGNCFCIKDNDDEGMGYCRAAQNDVDNMFYCPMGYECLCEDCEYYDAPDYEEDEDDDED